MSDKVLIPRSVGNDDFQTPPELAVRIVVALEPDGVVLEPCRGDGNFWRALPPGSRWCEIKEGRDFMDFDVRVDWVITNPPFSKLRKFLCKAMSVSENVAFLTSVNHFWLKARIRDMGLAGFGFREILLCETPATFPQSGFQIGVVHIRKGYSGPVVIRKLP